MFKGLFGKKKPAETAQRQKRLAPGISQAILGVVGARSIPPMASAAQKAFQLATNPKADARDFVEVIESDEGLSARVLKIANSVYFDRGKKSSTIQESVVVIGIKELRSLLNATTLSEIFPSKHPTRTQLWANNLGTAIIAKALAQRLLPSKSDLAFLAGLMHDVGKLLLIQRVADDYQQVYKKVENEGCDFCSAEETLFPFNHTQVGELIGTQWNFSRELIEVIAQHHQPWHSLPSPLPASLIAIVKAADTVCHAAGIGHPRGFKRFQSLASNSLEETWEALAIAPAERKGIYGDLCRSYELEHDIYAHASSEVR
jgi:putative nucleotidyltransferase with HDIG domain